MRLLLSASDRQENAAVRDVARAYNQARRSLLAAIIEAWGKPGALTPGAANQLLVRLNILSQIDARLLQLESQVGETLRRIVTDADAFSLAQIRREIALLPAGLRPDVAIFSAIDTELIEELLPAAIEEAELGTAALRGTLRRELRSGLLQGEPFDVLARRLFTTQEPSTWRNGMVSAERMTRRLVIHAQNAAHTKRIAQAAAEVPEVRKQVSAAINSSTTQTCLRAHGQIVDVDEPFELAGEPKFARRMMHTPFHWNCRSTVTMWHPAFERGGLTTANMRKSADAEAKRR